MPVIPTVLTGSTFVNGLLTSFREAYAMPTPTSAWVSDCMDLALPSNSRQELYAYHNTAPYPSFSPYGDTMRFKGFSSVQWQTINYPYKLAIGWNAFDRADDKLQDLMKQAQMGGQHFKTLPERVLIEFLLGSTSLLPTLPNAPDGVALYYATDGSGANRFGVSGGNIETGGGVASASAVRTDFWQVRARFQAMQDTEGQPLWDAGLLDGGFTVVYSSANEEVFREAFVQGRTLAGPLSSTSNGAVTNTIMESGLAIRLCPTQRLLGTDDWFVFANKSPYKPLYRQIREDVKETFHTYDNSDHASQTDEEWVQWVARYGFGVGPAYGTIKVNN